jgi:hypothetical protein
VGGARCWGHAIECWWYSSGHRPDAPAGATCAGRYYWLQNSWWAAYTVLPALHMVLLTRRRTRWHENALIGAWVALLGAGGGAAALGAELATVALMAAVGQLLFHLQHTFPLAYKSRPPYYSSYTNGLRGCSFLLVPRALAFFLAGIEYHHIHHLNTSEEAQHGGWCMLCAGGVTGPPVPVAQGSPATGWARATRPGPSCGRRCHA